ncbi:MAG: starvation-inducible DNA-binding protein [Paraglaciecola sp.]|jgi:starvation-inducible DNA-binding protein
MNYLGFDKAKTKETIAVLNDLLCNYHVYYQNLRNFHWNIQGQNFFELHAQFENLYNDARLKIDEIAERILTLRHRPLSKMSDYLKKSDIKEPKAITEDRKMVASILDNHATLITKMRTVLEKAGDAGDEGTIDMVGGFLESLEKRSWMLDAWLGKK